MAALTLAVPTRSRGAPAPAAEAPPGALGLCAPATPEAGRALDPSPEVPNPIPK